MSDMSIMQEFLHEMDRYPMRGMPEAMVHPQKRERYALMTRRVEAWSGAKLDGVAMPREAALSMLEAGRPAEDEAGEAVWQRYRLLEAIETNADQDTTADDLQHYAGLVNLQIPADALDPIVQLMNGESPGHFMHPFLRAFTVFDEVNQLRVKEPEAATLFRALFYRVMLHHDYPPFRFLALSAQENCFVRQPPPSCEEEGIERILLFMQGVEEAKKAANALVVEDEAKFELPEELAARASTLNHRQRIFLAQAARKPEAAYTMATYQKEHGVAYATARADLYELRDAGLLRARKQGKAWFFSWASNPVVEKPKRPVVKPPSPPVQPGNPEKDAKPANPSKKKAEKTWYFW
jgi:hypothetical protein